jgi:hypothetical protein
VGNDNAVRVPRNAEPNSENDSPAPGNEGRVPENPPPAPRNTAPVFRHAAVIPRDLSRVPRNSAPGPDVFGAFIVRIARRAEFGGGGAGGGSLAVRANRFAPRRYSK